jgi:hypothetical protein
LTGIEISNGWGFAAVCVLVAAFVFVTVLGYRIIRGESLVHRTRLGVFVERDRFDDEPTPPPEEDGHQIDSHNDPKHD